MTKYLIVAVALLIGLLSFQSWRLENSQQAEAIATAENKKLEMAVNNITAALKKEREANNHAQVIHQQQLKRSTDRRQAAETAYRKISKKARIWNSRIVPNDIAASLCITPGSCTMPGASNPSGKSTATGKRTTTQKRYLLSNQSLRDGIEDLRQSLANCNAKIQGVAAWKDSIKNKSSLPKP